MHVTCVADARLVPPSVALARRRPPTGTPTGATQGANGRCFARRVEPFGVAVLGTGFSGDADKVRHKFLPDCRVDGRPPPATASSRRWGHTQAKSEPRTPRTEQESCIIESGRPGLLARRARVRLRRTAARRLAGAAGLGVARAAGRADPRGQLLRRDRRRREGTCCCRAPRDAGTRNRPGHRC